MNSFYFVEYTNGDGCDIYDWHELMKEFGEVLPKGEIVAIIGLAMNECYGPDPKSGINYLQRVAEPKEQSDGE